MAAALLGRAPCPECGFDAAHVKQNPDKHPYRYCPECGANYATRNSRQARDLIAKVRPEAHAKPLPEPTPAPSPAPAPANPPPAARPAGLFSMFNS